MKIINRVYFQIGWKKNPQTNYMTNWQFKLSFMCTFSHIIYLINYDLFK